MAIRITNARWYPQYHIAAPGGWVNDPNGFCFYKGQYHFFYQHHPHSAQWGPMHWGHAVSKDLIHWEHLPIALAPTEPYENEGCFSGGGIEKDGRLYLFYTGNYFDHEAQTHGQCQCMAYSDDGINFTKYENNPIIVAPVFEDIFIEDFRDPKVWQQGDTYYMVVGVRTADNLRGQVMIFESKDLLKWNFKNIMARAEGNQGSMWECPNFANIEGKDVLILSPQGIKRVGNMYKNLYQSGYFIGNLDYATGTFAHGDFELLDYGFDYYAPQITEAPDGRIILIAWQAMWYNIQVEHEDGWAGMMTIPRELHIKDGKLLSVPVKEMENLRTMEKSYENLNFFKPMKFDGVTGEVGEMILDIDLTATKKFEIHLRSSADQVTVLSYDAAMELFKFNRDKAGAGGDGERECSIPPSDRMKLQIFLDRSSVEIFINDGERVLSNRIYPRQDSTDIVFVPQDGAFKIDSLKFYTLGVGIPQPVI